MRERILAFIPKHISNKTILGFMEFLRRIAHISKRKIRDHLKKNEAIFQSNGTEGFIENQNDLKDVSYGKKNLAFSGCEIIAAYNALVKLGGVSNFSLPKLISEFEKDGMVFGGRFGTSPVAILHFFLKNGYKCDFAHEESAIRRIESKYDSFIVTIYNDRNNIKRQIHTININREMSGLVAHNVYGNGAPMGPFPSFEVLLGSINQGKSKMICIFGIGK
ncbi:MAG: hypothetical protein J5537_11790 [Lachnospiraceae bacterium]|nr:hypothetical protein [Lachnospiraceae bacterium]